jgi:hypothetical protein
VVNLLLFGELEKSSSYRMRPQLEQLSEGHSAGYRHLRLALLTSVKILTISHTCTEFLNFYEWSFPSNSVSARFVSLASLARLAIGIK